MHIVWLYKHLFHSDQKFAVLWKLTNSSNFQSFQLTLTFVVLIPHDHQLHLLKES